MITSATCDRRRTTLIYITSTGSCPLYGPTRKIFYSCSLLFYSSLTNAHILCMLYCRGPMYCAHPLAGHNNYYVLHNN